MNNGTRAPTVTNPANKERHIWLPLRSERALPGRDARGIGIALAGAVAT
jgi:hypothetical protein